MIIIFFRSSLMISKKKRGMMFPVPGCLFPVPGRFRANDPWSRLHVPWSLSFSLSSLFPAVLGLMFPVPGCFKHKVPCSWEPLSEPL